MSGYAEDVISNYPGVMNMWHSKHDLILGSAPKDEAEFHIFSEQLRYLMTEFIKERYTPEQLEELAERVEPAIRKRCLFIADCIRHGFKYALSELNNAGEAAGQTWAYDLLKAYNYAGLRGLTNPSSVKKEIEKNGVPVNEIWGIRQVIRLSIPEIVMLVKEMKEIAIEHPDIAQKMAHLSDRMCAAFSGTLGEAGLVFGDEIKLMHEAIIAEKEKMRAEIAELEAESQALAKTAKAAVAKDPDKAASAKDREWQGSPGFIDRLAIYINDSGRVDRDGKLLKS